MRCRVPRPALRRDPLAGAARLSALLSARRLAGALAGCLAVTAPAAAETMSGALSRAYIGNPDLNQQRAGTRAQDENIPRATAGWRPTVTATGQFGYNYLDTTQGGVRTHGSTPPTTVALNVTQNVFNGNRTLNSVRQAEFEYLRLARKPPQYRTGRAAERRDGLYERAARYGHPRSAPQQHHRSRGAVAPDAGPVQRRRGDAHRRRAGGIRASPVRGRIISPRRPTCRPASPIFARSSASSRRASSRRERSRLCCRKT